MERDPANKIVVVTGGASGIGYQITDKFLQNGAKLVIILDLNETEGTKAVNELNTKHGNDKAIFMKCDVTKDLEEISKNIFDKYQVDVLVNNAGVLNEGSLRLTIEINVVALIEWSMKFWEHMRIDKGGKGGTIINIGSMYSFMIDQYAFYYKASKHAVMGFSRSLGHKQNFNEFGVRVVILCPGYTFTNISVNSTHFKDHEQRYIEYAKTMTWQKPDAVGQAAVDVFKNAESGTAWSIIGGELNEVDCVQVSTSCKKL